MKIYIASKFALKNRVIETYRFLQSYGHQITCIWWDDDIKRIGGSDKDWYNLPIVKYICDRDFKGVDNADILILVADTEKTMCFNGANVELGYALAKNKKIYIFGKVDRNALYSNCIIINSFKDLECVLRG